MDKKTISFFRRSIISVVAVSIVVFIALTAFMSVKTEESVREISYRYMSEMSIQVQQKFQSIIDLRLSQVEGIERRTPPEDVVYGEAMLDELITNAQVRDFTYLALYTEDGEDEVIYGDKLHFMDGQNVMERLMHDGSVVASAETAEGERVLVLGVKAEYPMENGHRSAALFAGFSMDYLNEALFLDEEDTEVYYHIIDVNGNFVIRNSGAFRESYFERIMEMYEPYEGKTGSRYTVPAFPVIPDGT